MVGPGGGGGGKFASVVVDWLEPLPPMGSDVLGLDALGHLFVTLISLLFLATAVYFVGYHRKALLCNGYSWPVCWRCWRRCRWRVSASTWGCSGWRWRPVRWRPPR